MPTKIKKDEDFSEDRNSEENSEVPSTGDISTKYLKVPNEDHVRDSSTGGISETSISN